MPDDVDAVRVVEDWLVVPAEPSKEAMVAGGLLIEEGLFESADPNDTVFDCAGRVYRAMTGAMAVDAAPPVAQDGSQDIANESDEAALQRICAEVSGQMAGRDALFANPAAIDNYAKEVARRFAKRSAPPSA